MSQQNPSKLGDPPSASTTWPCRPLTQENLESNDRSPDSQPCDIPMQKWLVDTSDKIATLGMASNANRKGLNGDQVAGKEGTVCGVEKATEKTDS
ncbi:hypothetical protein Q7P37_008208 [Cladosporium fusiforme]